MAGWVEAPVVTLGNAGSNPTWSVKWSEKCLRVDTISLSTWFGVRVNQEVPLLNNQLVPCNAKHKVNKQTSMRRLTAKSHELFR